MANVTPTTLQQYISDPIDFAKFSSTESFREYVNYVIYPSYGLHQEMGLLKNTMSGQQLDEEMSFRNFFSGRMLWVSHFWISGKHTNNLVIDSSISKK